MAQLRRAISDGHFYILAGQSKGTWQVSDAGIQVLRRHQLRLPREGEGVDLDRAWWRYLWDEGLLYTYGIPYDRYADSDAELQHEPGDAPGHALPLVLCPSRRPGGSWSLAVELAALPDGVLATLSRIGATAASVTNASDRPVPIRQIQRSSCLMPLVPQSAPYILCWLDSGSRAHELEGVNATPGLSSTPHGVVFAESRRTPGVWRRCLPGGHVAFWGTLHWLAWAEYKPDWSGIAHPEGEPQEGWQLWRFTVDEDAPDALDAVRAWLADRQLVLTEHAQRLELVSPPVAMTADGWALVGAATPVIIGCYPPLRPVPGLRSRAHLAITRVTSDHSHLGATHLDLGIQPSSAEAETPLFARWLHPEPGDYRVQILGDSTAEPLFIRVLHGSGDLLRTPPWLHGLTCRLKTVDGVVSFDAFSSQVQFPPPSANDEPASPVMTVASRSALAEAEWEIEPLDLPMDVTWNPVSATAIVAAARGFRIDSSAALTRLWRETIWPLCRTSGAVSIHLDAGSYGRIACTVGLPAAAQSQQPAPRRTLSRAGRAELAWLARCCAASRAEPAVPLPGDMHRHLRRLMAAQRSLEHMDTAVLAAIAMLDRCARVPAWALPHLRRLFHIRYTNRSTGVRATTANHKAISAAGSGGEREVR